MKSEKFILCVIAGLFFLISGCQDDNKNGDYSGVSELISDRNRARHEVAENPPLKSPTMRKATSQETGLQETAPEKKKKDLSSIILYEEDVKIVGTQSGRTMAKGVAYVNKQGQIVRIKIIKE